MKIQTVNLHRGLARLALVLTILLAMTTLGLLSVLTFAPELSTRNAWITGVFSFTLVFWRGRELFTSHENPDTAHRPFLAFSLFVTHACIASMVTLYSPFATGEIATYTYLFMFVPAFTILLIEQVCLLFLGLCAYVADGFRRPY